MTKSVIENFLAGAPRWIERLERINQINGMNVCMTCGAEPDDIRDLIVAIKELQEKSWKYDELCK